MKNKKTGKIISIIILTPAVLLLFLIVNIIKLFTSETVYDYKEWIDRSLK